MASYYFCSISCIDCSQPTDNFVYCLLTRDFTYGLVGDDKDVTSNSGHAVLLTHSFKSYLYLWTSLFLIPWSEIELCFCLWVPSRANYSNSKVVISGWCMMYKPRKNNCHFQLARGNQKVSSLVWGADGDCSRSLSRLFWSWEDLLTDNWYIMWFSGISVTTS